MGGVCYPTLFLPGSKHNYAFKRTPITSDALQWDKREGSYEARYRFTELSIELDAKDLTSEFNDSTVRSGKFHDFFLLGDIDLFKELEILTIICDTPIPRRTNFVDYIVSVLPHTHFLYPSRKLSR